MTGTGSIWRHSSGRNTQRMKTSFEANGIANDEKVLKMRDVVTPMGDFQRQLKVEDRIDAKERQRQCSRSLVTALNKPKHAKRRKSKTKMQLFHKNGDDRRKKKNNKNNKIENAKGLSQFSEFKTVNL